MAVNKIEEIEKRLERTERLLSLLARYISLRENPPNMHPEDYKYLAKYLEELRKEIEELSSEVDGQAQSGSTG